VMIIDGGRSGGSSDAEEVFALHSGLCIHKIKRSSCEGRSQGSYRTALCFESLALGAFLPKLLKLGTLKMYEIPVAEIDHPVL
ncbi:Hypothetical predicted protein, partial [Olea europaea subsp. europaea]